MSQKDNLHLEACLKRELTKLYKESFGKGPDTAIVKIQENIAIVKLEGGLTLLERTLMNTIDGFKLVRNIRDQLIEEHFQIYSSALEEVVNTKLDKVSYAISNDNDTIYMFLIFKDKISNPKSSLSL